MEKKYKTSHGTFIADQEKQRKLVHYLAQGKSYQEDEIAVLSKHVDKKSVVVDVGAHIGTISIPLSKIVHSVIAFEPVQEHVELLRQNLALNNVTNVTVYDKALGRAHTRVDFVPRDEKETMTSAVHEGTSVEMITLDSVHAAPSLIKIDVEGYEIEVLQGARDTIRKHKPVIFFEVSMVELRRRGDWWLSEVSTELKSQGYKIYFPTPHGNKRVRSIAWFMFRQAPKAFIGGKLLYTVNLLALPSEYAPKEMS